MDSGGRYLGIRNPVTHEIRRSAWLHWQFGALPRTSH